MTAIANNYSNLTRASCGPQRRLPAPGTYPYYISLYVFPVCFIIGTIGNLLILVILKKMKLKSKPFLAAMAMSDFCFFIPMFFLTLNAYDDLANDERFVKIWYFLHKPAIAIANLFSTASIWFVLCIAVDRLVAVRCPFRAQSLTDSKFINILVVSIITIMSTVLQIPIFFGNIILTSKYENKTVYCSVIFRGSLNSAMISVSQIMIPLVSVIVPMIMLAIINVLLLYSIQQSRQTVTLLGTSSNKQSNNNEKKITKLVLSILITFFVLNLPSVVVAILKVEYSTSSNIQHLKILFNIPAHISNYLVCLNKVLNFFIYFWSSSQFRKKMKLLLKKSLRREWSNGATY